MKLDNLRSNELTFSDTFCYLREILFLNFSNFLKLFCLWVLFSFILVYCLRFFPVYFVVLSFIFAYIVFYLFYLTAIIQSRAQIDKKKIGVFKGLKEVSKGFIKRKGLDLLELLPAAIVVFLIVFFPSGIFAIPLAFIITLATIIFIVYTILAQPVVVIKKIAMFPAARYSMNLISGYLSFVIGLIATLAFACLILYIPFTFIKMPLFWYEFLLTSLAGIEVILFAILLTIVYTNLEIAWSIGFRIEEINPSETQQENPHELTELFNTAPEIKITEDIKEDLKNK